MDEVIILAKKQPPIGGCFLFYGNCFIVVEMFPALSFKITYILFNPSPAVVCHVKFKPPSLYMYAKFISLYFFRFLYSASLYIATFMS